MRDGIIVVYKPKGITSHDVVERVRDILQTKKVGHAGTLDPLATGVLVILVGRATKWFDRFLALEKEYNATLTLGKITDTGDAQGKTLEVLPVPEIKENLLKDILKGFLGEIQQVPPMVSALRCKGKRLYKLHAKGIEVPRQPRKIIIKDLQLLRLRSPEIDFYVKCSRGTYVRQLACDIALRLGSGGHISRIERLSVGPFNIKEAVPIDKLNESYIQQWKD